MKLSLSIKIILKDFFPKWNSIPYNNFVCLINYNNTYTSQIKFSDIPDHSFVIHKVESFNSNIMYNFHVLDSYKKSLIGGCHLCINFDKIKNLNINDTLTQEGNYKLIIDSITKRKFFDNITNMGDIYLTIATEIKILNKKLYDMNRYRNNLYSFNNENINKSNINNKNNNFLNLTTKTFKKQQIVRTMKNNYESLSILDSLCGKSELNTDTNTKLFEESDYNTFYQCSGLKKHKSTNKAKVNLKNIIKSNNILNNNYNRYKFNNSYNDIMSPKDYNNNYSKKKNKNNKKNRITLYKNRVITLNLIEQKVDKPKTKESINNLLESYSSNDFCKTQMGQNFPKTDNVTYNTFNKISCDKKEKKEGKSLEESNFFKKKNKNKININFFLKNEISTERKLNCKKNLGLKEYTRINTEIIQSNNFTSHNKNLSTNNNINNIFLQTEYNALTAQKLPKNKIIVNKGILKKIKQIITDKDKYQNNIIIEQTRGTFSPKLALKQKLDEVVMLTEANDKIKSRNKDRLNKRVMTPKGNKMKYIKLNNTSEKNNDKTNEELRKKLLGIIECYSLLMKKIRYNYENNKEFAKKLKEIKERYNNLNKYKNNIENLKNVNESKKILEHSLNHFEEEKLITKMVNIKLKENSINKIIFGDIEKNESTVDKINILLSQKKEILLNLIKNVVKYFGNISQIYNEENDKKRQLIKVLEKYEIKEKNKTNLNYINYMNKRNNFNDKVITEVDEEKENEEEFDENIRKNSNLILDNEIMLDNNYNQISVDENNIKEIKINIPNLYGQNKTKFISNIDEGNNNYEENSNNFINKILIEDFPEKYETELKFIHLEKNKYKFNDTIFYAYIEDNNVILKDDNFNKKYSLNEFYNIICSKDKIGNKSNFIYTKKIRQRYIKIKSYEDIDQNTEKKMRNENSTTMDTEFIQQSMISRGNEISEEKI